MGINILVVDDDKKLLSVLKTLLEEGKNSVSICSDGLEAIKKVSEQKYDLIITDLMLPGTDGLEVLKESRQIQPDILVILITGFASLETAIQAIREGAYDYITKPFRLEEIKIVVNNARERIRLIKENQRLLKELQEAYKQVHMMKRIIGEKENDHDESKLKQKDNGPVIAGSLLPLYYTENRSGIKAPMLSDLERISVLREKGLLSEEEFILCKSKLFRNMSH